MKFCKDCKWCKPDKNCGERSLELADCVHPQNTKLNPVTGENEPYRLCKNERTIGVGGPRCGPTGENWGAK